MAPDPEHRLPPEVLAGLLRDQLEAYAVLADRISLAGQAIATGRDAVEEVEEVEDTVRWLQQLTRTVLGGFQAGDGDGVPCADVSAAARRAVRRWARTMPDLDMSVDVDRGTWVAVPPTILERILQGLLANAGRSARRRVRLVALRIGSAVELRTEGDAPALDDASGARGPSGSDPEVEVVRWLVEGAGGSIAAAASRSGVGGRMSVRLPAGTPPARTEHGNSG